VLADNPEEEILPTLELISDISMFDAVEVIELSF
jgi:hypothetical protein